MEKTKTRKNRGIEFVKVTFTVTYPLLSLFDAESQKRGYTRSEALRNAIREQLERWTGRVM